jgi:hypothetical protein
MFSQKLIASSEFGFISVSFVKQPLSSVYNRLDHHGVSVPATITKDALGIQFLEIVLYWNVPAFSVLSVSSRQVVSSSLATAKNILSALGSEGAVVIHIFCRSSSIAFMVGIA